MISISRKSRYFDKLRNYKIFIDNIYYGDIGDGETKKIGINEGQHSVYLKIDWCRSNVLNFVECDNKLIELYCGNSMSGAKNLLVFLYISILKNKYLFIKIKDSI